MRLPQTSGELNPCPSVGVFQAMFTPEPASQLVGAALDNVQPALAPRKRGQLAASSAAAAASGPESEPESPVSNLSICAAFAGKAEVKLRLMRNRNAPTTAPVAPRAHRENVTF